MTRIAAERKAADYLAEPGAPVVLVGPAEIGKTYCLEHLLEQNRQTGDAVVRVNLEFLGQEAEGSADRFLKAFAWEIVDQLELDDAALARAWSRDRSPARKLTYFLQRSVLPHSAGTTFLAIDRADVLGRGEDAMELLSTLRHWSELHGSPWDKLRVLLAVSTEPELLSERIHSSPFNLTDPIRLAELDGPQVQDLARRYGLAWTEGEIADLMDLVGGHPYLVSKVMYPAAAQGCSLDEVLADPLAESGLFTVHLAALMLQIRRDERLASAIREVLDGDAGGPDVEVAQRLLRAGLLRGAPGEYAIRYKIYELYFRKWLR